MNRKTGLMWHERFMWHDQGRYAGILPADFPLQPGAHHEHPETKRRLKNLLDVTGLSDHLMPVKARSITREELLRVHTPAYLTNYRRAIGNPRPAPVWTRPTPGAAWTLPHWLRADAWRQ